MQQPDNSGWYQLPQEFLDLLSSLYGEGTITFQAIEVRPRQESNPGVTPSSDSVVAEIFVEGQRYRGSFVAGAYQGEDGRVVVEFLRTNVEDNGESLGSSREQERLSDVIRNGHRYVARFFGLRDNPVGEAE